MIERKRIGGQNIAMRVNVTMRDNGGVWESAEGRGNCNRRGRQCLLLTSPMTAQLGYDKSLSP